MEKLTYSEISNDVFRDREFHRFLIEQIEDARENQLEKTFPGIKAGQIIYPEVYIKRHDVKKYVSEIMALDRTFEEDISSGIKLNFSEFTKN